jgi:hypothetical protein
MIFRGGFRIYKNAAIHYLSELIVANCILTESKASESEKSPLSTARR